jgi:hypothetical protein
MIFGETTLTDSFKQSVSFEMSGYFASFKSSAEY